MEAMFISHAIFLLHKQYLLFKVHCQSFAGMINQNSERSLVYHFVHISSISIHVHAQHNSVEYPYTIAELYNLPSFEEGPQHIRRG